MSKILAELRSYNNWLVTKATNIRNRHFRTRRRRVLLVVPVLIVTCLLLCLATGVFSKPRDNTPWPSRPLTDRYGSIFDTPMISGMQNFTQLSYNLPFEPEWRREPHLIVYGVLATDKPERRVIRNLQRSTWVRYPDVATRKNAFKGLMLALYVISPHASISPNITLDMTEEYRRYRDVLLLRMKEELPDQVKVVGKNGGYGMPLQVSNARKRLLFLLYGHYAFPTTPFFGKGDDDAYVYVPEFMRMLRQLPRLNIIYGSVTRGHHQDYHMALGYTYVISRDILPDVMKDDVLNYFLNRPFNVEHWGIYEDIAFHHEDWTIGRSMYRRYMTTTMGPPRVVPAEPPFDKRLPPVEGWGKHYMAYVRDPQNVPHTGRAVSNDGRYNFTYAFPPPDEFLPGNVLWVDDRCRIANQRWPPNATSKDNMRLVVAHRPTTEEQFQAYWKFHEDLGDDEQMMRPVEVNMTSPKHYYYLAEIRFPNGPGECKVNYWV